MKKLKAAVIGAYGMLGTDLCKVLEDEYEVIQIDLPDVDITDYHSIYNFISRSVPDIVIHTAAFTDVDGCEFQQDKAYLVNSIGTQYVALSCLNAGVPCLYISTDYVFDGKKGSPYVEYDTVSPLSIYGKSKLAGEQYIISLLKKFYIVRTSWLYGRKRNNFINAILKNAKEKDVLRVIDDKIGSPTYTLDLAFEIKRLIKTGFYGIYHISNTGSVSRYEEAKAILKFANISKEIIPVKSEEFILQAERKPAERPDNSSLRNYCLELTIGNKMRSWQDAVEAYVKEYLS